MCCAVGPIPGVHLAGAHAWDPAGDLSLRAGRRRSWGAAFPSADVGEREAPAGLID